MERERARGIPPARRSWPGFPRVGRWPCTSGCAIPNGGILALSCYVPLAKTLPAERHVANHAVPIFLAHGLLDPVIPVQYGRATVRQLTELDYPLEAHEYPMGHEVNWDEIQDISRWLQRVLA